METKTHWHTHHALKCIIQQKPDPCWYAFMHTAECWPWNVAAGSPRQALHLGLCKTKLCRQPNKVKIFNCSVKAVLIYAAESRTIARKWQTGYRFSSISVTLVFKYMQARQNNEQRVVEENRPGAHAGSAKKYKNGTGSHTHWEQNDDSIAKQAALHCVPKKRHWCYTL